MADRLGSLVPRMNIDTLISAIEMDLGVAWSSRANNTVSEVSRDVPDDCSSCSGSTYSCCESCSSSSGTDSDHSENHVKFTENTPDSKSGKYICEHCNRSFLWADAYKTHLSTHISEKPHVCTICDKMFNNASSLASHARQHRSECPRECQKCDSCEFQADNASVLAQHMINVHETIDKGRKSSESNEATRPKRNRKLSAKVRENLDDGEVASVTCGQKKDIQASDSSHKNLDERTSLHYCRICHMEFSTSSKLQEHFIFIHDDNKPYSCRLCKKTFQTPQHLKSHSVSHSTDRPFVCKVCSASFPRKHTLMKHTRIHTKEKPYKCDECDLSFSQTENLKDHKKSHNPDLQNTLSCKTCGKKFTHKRNLNVHERIHTGVKKYECPVCLKTFIQASGRSRHMKRHTGDKPHVCETCGLRYGYPSELNDHVNKIHKNVKKHSCKVCSKFFHSQRDLDRHSRTHTGERPYTCDICNKSFSQSYSLTMHLNTHDSNRSKKQSKGKKKDLKPDEKSSAESSVTNVKEIDTVYNSTNHQEQNYHQFPMHHDYALQSSSQNSHYNYVPINPEEYSSTDKPYNNAIYNNQYSNRYMDSTPYQDNATYTQPVYTSIEKTESVNPYQCDTMYVPASNKDNTVLPPVNQLPRPQIHYKSRTPVYSSNTDHDYQSIPRDESGIVSAGGDVEEEFRCEGCGERFITSSDLLDHLKAHIDAELAEMDEAGD